MTGSPLPAATASALLLGASAALAHDRRAPLSVEQVIARHHELDGRTIEVRGWLTYCHPRSCILSSQQGDAGDSHLSIASSSRFDRRATRMIGLRITVRATLNDNCLHGRGSSRAEEPVIVVCTDRASELRNPSLVEPHH